MSAENPVASYPRTQRIYLVLAIVLGGIALDHLTKWAAILWLKGAPPIVFTGDLFRLQYATNTGAFLSLFGTLSAAARFWLLVAFNSVILSGVAVYLVSKYPVSRGNAVALSLILSGGVGNLIDRVFRDGVVVDFMNVGITLGSFSLRSGIFNIADLGIVGGLILLVAVEFFAGKPQAPAA
jgi:signal peptidase II